MTFTPMGRNGGGGGGLRGVLGISIGSSPGMGWWILGIRRFLGPGVIRGMEGGDKREVR